jgi:hypothetical protein
LFLVEVEQLRKKCVKRRAEEEGVSLEAWSHPHQYFAILSNIIVKYG